MGREIYRIDSGWERQRAKKQKGRESGKQEQRSSQSPLLYFSDFLLF